MQKEVISTRQAVLICTMFVFASNIIIGSGSKVGQDTWLSVLLSFLLTLPTILVYARIMDLNPEMNIVQIAETVLGKIAGKIVLVLMTWYSISLGSLVLSNFYYYINVTALQETPHLYVAGILIITCIYMAKSGIEVLGKWSMIIFPIVLLTLVLTVVLCFNRYEWDRLLPVASHPFGKILKLSYSYFTFPFAEAVLFLFFGHSIRKKYSSYKIYAYSSLIGLILLAVIVVRNITVLGPKMMAAVYFPSYIAARIISVGDFLTRIEGTISINFILSGIVKITVCLFAASIGLAGLTGVADYKKMIIPVGVLILAISMINYPSIMEMYAFIEVYEYYAILFQLIIPFVIWVGSEIQAKRKKAGIAAGK